MTHSDYIFFVQRDKQLILPIPNDDYIALMHAEKPMPEYASQKISIAILYVSMEAGKPQQIVNATYSFLQFDSAGFADAHFAGNSLEENRAFFNAAQSSKYEDTDCDPAVQTVREQIGDDVSWVPTDQQLKHMQAIIFGDQPL